MVFFLLNLKGSKYPVNYPEDVWPIERVKGFRQPLIGKFAEDVAAKTEQIIREFAHEAPAKIHYLFQSQALFEIAHDGISRYANKAGLVRITGMPNMLEITFNRGLSWYETRFPWLDRNWFLANYNLLNPDRNSESLRDGGIRVFLDTKGIYHYCHVLISKKDNFSYNVYRSLFSKQQLALALIDDYVDAINDMGNIDKSELLNPELFIEATKEQFESYLEVSD